MIFVSCPIEYLRNPEPDVIRVVVFCSARETEKTADKAGDKADDAARDAKGSAKDAKKDVKRNL